MATLTLSTVTKGVRKFFRFQNVRHIYGAIAALSGVLCVLSSIFGIQALMQLSFLGIGLITIAGAFFYIAIQFAWAAWKLPLSQDEPFFVKQFDSACRWWEHYSMPAHARKECVGIEVYVRYISHDFRTLHALDGTADWL